MSDPIYLCPPHMGDQERRLLLEAFDSNWIAPLGPHVDAFEREVADYVGVGHAAALSSGTAALHLALRILGVQRGDAVLVSTLTFIGSVGPVVQMGAEPVFIDSTRSTWNIDPNLVEEELKARAARGKLPKAVIAVDLYGQCADYDALEELCTRYEVPLIEDAAEALGATFGERKAGSFGAMSLLSFNGNKIITTSGGGMLLSNREDWIKKARFLATQARDPAPHYEHTEVGYNYRLSNLLAAVGRGQLQKLPQRVEAHRKTYRFYQAAFSSREGLTLAPHDPRGQPNCWLTCVLVHPKAFGATAEHIRVRLQAHNIEARPVWKPMHRQPVFKDATCRGGAVAEDLFVRGLCLPSGSSLTLQQKERIAELVLSCA